MFWIALAVFFVLLVIVVLAKQKQSRDDGGALSFKIQAALFTPAERSFLGVLDLAVGKDFRIFGKVRVGDVLAPQDGLNNRARTTTLNKINRKHFDFVLCKPDDLTVLCAIELNDKSHLQKNRRDRDAFLVNACDGAGLPLIMFDARRAYAPNEIGARIAEALSTKTPNRIEPVLQASALEDADLFALDSEIAPICPRCSGLMMKRTAKGGENAGKEFWGCSNFPRCREIVAT